MRQVNREILRIALPSVVANVTIPLLGLLDTAIAGHIGGAQTIGAIAVGSMIFNIIYWAFGFLRMGTSGLTAQATGAGDRSSISHLLQHSAGLSMVIAVALLLLQKPLCVLAMDVIGPSDDVRVLAESYFYVVVWGAVPTLLMMSIKGWLLGRQDSVHPMAISIGVNVLNVALSLMLVFGLKLGFIGIAWGTCLAEWLGLGYSVWVLVRKYRKDIADFSVATMFHLSDAGRFLRVNNHIFWRTLIMMAVTTFFLSVGARSGDVILAVNSLIMQLFTLFSYFMDGVAQAGEVVVGKYCGMGDRTRENETLRNLFAWGILIMAVFTLLYVALPRQIFSLLTNSTEVVDAAMAYRWWCALIPVCGVSAFVWDGVYIGVSRTRAMLMTVAVAGATFFALYYVLPSSWKNHRLWVAFLAYLAVRGIVQTILWHITEKPEN